MDKISLVDRSTGKANLLCKLKLKSKLKLTLREKCPYSEFFWSLFSRIWAEYGEIRRIYECGKIRTRKTIIRTLFTQYYFVRHILQKTVYMPPEVLYKKGVLKNLRPKTLLKKRLWRWSFFESFTKFSRARLFTEHLWTTASLFIYLYSYFKFI